MITSIIWRVFIEACDTVSIILGPRYWKLPYSAIDTKANVAILDMGIGLYINYVSSGSIFPKHTWAYLIPTLK